MLTKKQYRDKYYELPQKIREVLASEEFGIFIDKALSKSELNLPEDKLELVHEISSDVLLGTIDIKNLKLIISTRLTVKDDLAEKIAKTLSLNVFQKIDDIHFLFLSNLKKSEEEAGREFDISEYTSSMESESSYLGKDSLIDKIKSVLNSASNETETQKQFGVLSNPIWKNKLKEISEKYSLTQAQMDWVEKQVMWILVGLGSVEEMEDDMVSNISIPLATAQMIMSDIESRILDYLENQKNIPSVKLNNTENILTSQTKEVMPETKRNMTPMVEEGEKSLPAVAVLPLGKGEAHDATPEEKKWMEAKAPEQKKTENVPGNLPGAVPVAETGTKNNFYIQWPKKEPTPVPVQPSGGAEPVQKPVIGVPRYTGGSSEYQVASSKEEVQKNSNTAENQNSIDQKLNTVVSSTSSEPQKPKYAVDPYREPIE